MQGNKMDTGFLPRLISETANENVLDSEKNTYLTINSLGFGDLIVDDFNENGVNCNNDGNRFLFIDSDHDCKTFLRLPETIDDTDFLDFCDEDGNTSLMIACKHGLASIAEALIERYGCNIGTRNKAGKTALFLAVENGHVEIAQSLLDFGADVNESDTNGVTVLMTACKTGNPDMARLLLERGACVHTTGVFSGTAFIQTLYYPSDYDIENRTKILELLIKFGADVNEENGWKVTPLLTACRAGGHEIVEFLLKNGADVNAKFNGAETVLMSICDNGKWSRNVGQVLLKYGANANACDDKGKTVLMRACETGLRGFVRQLLTHGIDDIDARDISGMTAIMYAGRHGNIRCIEIMISADANLDLVSNEGNTLLSYAMGSPSNLECVKFLLRDGVLLENGKLKTVHKNARFSSNSLESVLLTIELDLFEWEFCPVLHFKAVCFAALKSGFCPGKIKYSDNDVSTMVSPLILATMENDIEAIDVFLQYGFYFPDDYRILTKTRDTKNYDEDKNTCQKRDTYTADVLCEVRRKPLSLLTWSFLTVSKAVSLTGAHNLRRRRVQTLNVPSIIKSMLTFQIRFNQF